MTGGWQTFRNRLYVLLFGSAVAVLAWVWQFDSVPPDLAEHLSVAAGLRPPTGTTARLWQYIAAPLCRCFGIETAEVILRVAGHVSLGVLAVLAVMLFEMIVPASLRRGEHVVWWWRAWVRIVLFQGAAIFCCSDPVWRTFGWFSPSALQALLVVLTAICVVAYFKSGRRPMLFSAFATIGLLAADTPVGAVILFGLIALLYIRWRLYGVESVVLQENPLANALLPWRLTLSFLGGVRVGMALEVYAFGCRDGLAAFGWKSWSDYALAVPVCYLKALMAACSPAGIFIFFVVAVCPVLAELGFIKRATDDEKHLEYFDGLMFLVCGMSATMSSGGSDAISGVTILLTDVVPSVTGRKIPQKHYVLASRIALVVALAIAFVITLFVDDVIAYIQKVVGFLLPGVGVTMLLGRFWRRATWQGAYAAILSGTLFGLVVLFVPPFAEWVRLTLGGPAIPATALAVTACVAASLLSKPSTATEDERVAAVLAFQFSRQKETK